MNIKLAELIFYTLVNILPVASLALTPFKDCLRVPSKWLWPMVIALCIIDGVLSCCALYLGHALFFTLVSVGVYLGFYLLSVRAGILKLLAVLLILLNYASLATVTADFLAGLFNVDMPYRYSFAYTAFYLLGLAAAYPFYYQTLNKRIRPQMSLGDAEQIWRYLWIIPGTFCAVYYYFLFSIGGIAAFTRSPGRVLFFWLIQMGSLTVMYVQERFVAESRENLSLQEQNSRLALQSVQYEELKKDIEETRRARHDLRHHISAVQECIKNRDFDALERYMVQYQESLPSSLDETKIFCDNYAVNAVLRFYAEKAIGIADMSVTVKMENTVIPEPELCVLLGNLLKNAVEACAVQDKKGVIQVHIIQNAPSLLTITVDNTCPKSPVWEGIRLRSSKRDGLGIGTQSIRQTAERYNGDARFEWKDGVFYASVMLNP